jgi:hypothetical protein
MGKNVVDTMGGFADYFSATYLSYRVYSQPFTFYLQLRANLFRKYGWGEVRNEVAYFFIFRPRHRLQVTLYCPFSSWERILQPTYLIHFLFYSHKYQSWIL